jgi:hypothetical protein
LGLQASRAIRRWYTGGRDLYAIGATSDQRKGGLKDRAGLAGDGHHAGICAAIDDGGALCLSCGNDAVADGAVQVTARFIELRCAADQHDHRPRTDKAGLSQCLIDSARWPAGAMNSQLGRRGRSSRCAEFSAGARVAFVPRLCCASVSRLR